MKVIVTGGSGFLGSRLATKLVVDGHDVTLWTRNAQRLPTFVPNSVSAMQLDINNSQSLDSLPSHLSHFDAIFHLAADVDYFGKEKLLRGINVDGSTNVLKWACERGAKRFVFVSSIEAIGPGGIDGVPLDENAASSPVCSYGRSKLAAENALAPVADRAGMPLSVLRLGNVYGPGSLWLISSIHNALRGHGSFLNYLGLIGHALLNPLFVTDAVSGIEAAGLCERSAGTYILAGSESVRLDALARIVAEFVGAELPRSIRTKPWLRMQCALRCGYHRLIHRASLVDYFFAGGRQRPHRSYSSRKAASQFGFEPMTPLQTGIQNTLNWLSTQSRDVSTDLAR